jgi:hypothetical protein
MPKKIACFVNEKHTKELKKLRNDLIFATEIDDLPEVDFYIVSLKSVTKLHKRFRDFMRSKPSSGFIFLIGEDNEEIETEDFEIRDEPNTVKSEDGYSMFDSKLALELAV